MPLTVLIDFVIASCLIGWSPGPNNILLLSVTSKYGFKKSLQLMIGIWSGALIIMALCSLFCSILNSILPTITPYLKYAGAIYIIYLAYKTFTRSQTNDNSSDKRPSFITGFLLQFLNAKIILYGISMYTSYIMPYETSNIKLLLYSPLLILGTSSGNIIWSLIGTALNKAYNKYYKPINIIMGILLLWCAYKILFK